MSSTKLEEALEETTRIIKCVYTEMPNYDVILPLALEHGVASLPERCHLTPGLWPRLVL
jgi:DNA ligase-1